MIHEKGFKKRTVLNMKLQDNSKLVFIGDSISDYERARPVGEGLSEGLGNSYVRLVDAFLRTTYPQSCVRIVNMGISGNTTRDLLERWKTDVLDLKPDWLAILIGINDVWRQFDSPLMTEIQIDAHEYEQNLRSLITQAEPGLRGLILMTPYMMETNRADPMRARMDEFGAIVKKLAQETGAVLVDLQAAFDEYLQYHHSMSVAWDRIHPDLLGHMIIAKALLRELDYNWDGESISQ